MEQLVTWLTALIGLVIMIAGIFAKFQTKKQCEECRNNIAKRIDKVEDDVKDIEDKLAEISSNVIKILEKLQMFTESFCVVKGSISEAGRDIDKIKNDVTELQTIERIRNGSFIKD